MATVHSYARFSDPKQAAGDSERRQDEALQKFIKANNHTLSNLQLIDRGKSGFSGDKQKCLSEFLKILESNDGRIKAGDILFVEAVDRISRKGIRATQKTVNTILDHGVDIRIVSPLEKTYRADAVNELGDAIELAAFAYAAHIYSAMLSKRIKSYHEEARHLARTRGKIHESGYCPFWLTRSKDGFQVKEGARQAIKYIYEQTIEGMGGLRLAKKLNEKFPCFGGSGRWNERYLRHILNQRQALGEYQPHKLDESGKRVPEGEPIKNYFPALVSEDVWQKANAAARNRASERGPSGDFVNLFTGLVYHAVDKCSMQITSSFKVYANGSKVVYRRLKSIKGKFADGAPETILLPQFEEAILVFLGSLKQIDLSVFIDEPSKALELQTMESSLKAKQARVDQIQALEADDLALIVPQLRKLNVEIEGLKRKVAELKKSLTNQSGASVDHIKFLAKLEQSPENRQKLRESIKRVVQRINLLPVKLGTHRGSNIAVMVEVELINGKKPNFSFVTGKELEFASAYVDHFSGNLFEANQTTLSKLKRRLIEQFHDQKV